jgi:hypothetical protein
MDYKTTLRDRNECILIIAIAAIALLPFTGYSQTIDQNLILGKWELHDSPDFFFEKFYSSNGVVTLTSHTKDNFFPPFDAYFDWRITDDVLIETSRAGGNKNYKTILSLTPDFLIIETFTEGRRYVSTWTRPE